MTTTQPSHNEPTAPRPEDLGQLIFDPNGKLLEHRTIPFEKLEEIGTTALKEKRDELVIRIHEYEQAHPDELQQLEVAKEVLLARIKFLMISKSISCVPERDPDSSPEPESETHTIKEIAAFLVSQTYDHLRKGMRKVQLVSEYDERIRGLIVEYNDLYGPGGDGLDVDLLTKLELLTVVSLSRAAVKYPELAGRKCMLCPVFKDFPGIVCPKCLEPFLARYKARNETLKEDCSVSEQQPEAKQEHAKPID